MENHNRAFVPVGLRQKGFTSCRKCISFDVMCCRHFTNLTPLLQSYTCLIKTSNSSIFIDMVEIAQLRNISVEGKMKLLWKHQKCSTVGILSSKSNFEPHLGLKGFRQRRNEICFPLYLPFAGILRKALELLGRGMKIEYEFRQNLRIATHSVPDAMMHLILMHSRYKSSTKPSKLLAFFLLIQINLCWTSKSTQICLKFILV